MVSLVYISYLDSLANVKCAGIGSLLPHNQTEKRCLAGSVRSYNTDDTVGGQCEV